MIIIRNVEIKSLKQKQRKICISGCYFIDTNDVLYFGRLNLEKAKKKLIQILSGRNKAQVNLKSQSAVMWQHFYFQFNSVLYIELLLDSSSLMSSIFYKGRLRTLHSILLMIQCGYQTKEKEATEYQTDISFINHEKR